MGDMKEEISSISKSVASSNSTEFLGFISGLLRDKYATGPISSARKNCQVAHMLLLMLLPVMLLTGFIAYFMGNKLSERSQVLELRVELAYCLRIGHVVEYMQRERDVHILMMSKDQRARFVLEYYKKTDEALEDLPRSPPTRLARSPNMQAYNIDNIKVQLWLYRDLMQWNVTKNEERLSKYTRLINSLRDIQLNIILLIRYGQLWKLLVAYYKLIESAEEVGTQIKYGGRYLREGKFGHPDDLLAFARSIHLTNAFLSRANMYIPPLSDQNKLLEEILQLPWLVESAVMKDVYEDRLSLPPEEAVAKYLDIMVDFRNKISKLQEGVTNEIEAKLNEYDQWSLQILSMGILLAVMVVITSPILCRTVYKMTTSVQQCALHLADANKELKVEKKRTDTLLHQMLPRSVAQKLKRGQVEAEYFSSCSVLFCGIEEFIELTMVLTPTEIVNFLNDIFCLYDKVIDHYDVYKVESVGDVYMISSGVPKRNGRHHATAVAKCALDLLQSTRQHFNALSVKLSLHAGINTGSCMAAVVGTRRPRYCLFGDTVNIASRMQTSGEGNRIQISEKTKRFLSKTQLFLTEPRGAVNIKGKGMMYTHWLLGQVARPELHPRYGTMSVTSSDLDTSVTSALSKSFTSSKVGASTSQTSAESWLVSVEQTAMSAIPEAETGSSSSSHEGMVRGVSAAYPPTGGSSVPLTVLPKEGQDPAGADGDEFSEAFAAIENILREKEGSPPIFQLREGVHF